MGKICRIIRWEGACADWEAVTAPSSTATVHCRMDQIWESKKIHSFSPVQRLKISLCKQCHLYLRFCTNTNIMMKSKAYQLQTLYFHSFNKVCSEYKVNKILTSIQTYCKFQWSLHTITLKGPIVCLAKHSTEWCWRQEFCENADRSIKRLGLDYNMIRTIPAVVRTDPGVLLAGAWPLPHMLPVLLTAPEPSTAVSAVVELLLLGTSDQPRGSGPGELLLTVRFVYSVCFYSCPGPLLTLRTEEWSAGQSSSLLLLLSLMVASVMVEGVVHVDQPWYPVNIVLGGVHLQAQVWPLLH